MVGAFAPLVEAARVVGGDRVTVTNLTPTGVEPHDLELSTASVDRVLDADLVVYLGAGFQPAVEEVAPRTEGRALDVMPDGVDDPHVWLDPTRLITIVEQLRDALSEVDPPGAAAYRANAASYVDELEVLDAEMAAGLSSCERKVIVTAHAAFGHLARRYGLEQEAIAGLSPESEADPARLAELADEVADRGITTIFTETLVSPEIAETLAHEAGVRTAVLDPIEGFHDAKSSYASVMRGNLATLRTALGCR